jgi:hypothetical protein
MEDCCSGRVFAAESIRARRALWVVVILNALTFALKITADLALLDMVRDALIYGIGLYVVVSQLQRKGDESEPSRGYGPPLERTDVTRCSASMSTCLRC